jgi:prepilin-type N-terminal cleavage/methylation domain-containing protein
MPLPKGKIQKEVPKIHYCFQPRQTGFTLAELLICLTILGVIATFTIPKVLAAQQGTSWRATAKEAAAALSEAYTIYRLATPPTANTSTSDIAPYLNYVRLATSGTIDHVTGQTSLDCATAVPGCLRLHNGGTLFPGGSRFGNTNPTNYIHFHFDPDGRYSNSTTGPGKAISILLYYNGRVATAAERKTSDETYIGGTGYNWGPDTPADWFSW